MDVFTCVQALHKQKWLEFDCCILFCRCQSRGHCCYRATSIRSVSVFGQDHVTFLFAADILHFAYRLLHTEYYYILLFDKLPQFLLVTYLSASKSHNPQAQLKPIQWINRFHFLFNWYCFFYPAALEAEQPLAYFYVALKVFMHIEFCYQSHQYRI